MPKTQNIDTPNIHLLFENFSAILKEGSNGESRDLFGQSGISKWVQSVFKNLESHANEIGAQFFVPNKIKQFLITYRDSTLEAEKSELRKIQNEVSPEDQSIFKNKVSQNLIDYLDALKQEINSILNKDFNAEETEFYSEVKSPLEVLKKQCEQLAEQSQHISESYSNLKEAKPTIDTIRKQLSSVLDGNEIAFSKINKSTAVIKDLCDQSLNLKDLFKAYNEINSDVQQMQLSKNNIDLLLDQQIALLPGLQKVPVRSSAAQLFYKELSLQKSIKDWIQIDILPEIYEIWELNEEALGLLKSTSNNISNRIAIAHSNTNNSFDNADFLPAVESLEEKSLKYNQQALKLVDSIHEASETFLNFNTLIQESDSGNNASWSSAIEQIGIEESPIIVSTKSWLSFLKNKFNKFVNNILDEHQPNARETLIDHLRNAEFDKHSEFNSIFLTRPFSGKSFYVRRDDIHKQIHHSIDSWREGYRGGILITGNRFCGKTSLLDAVSSELMDMKMIKLYPGAEILYNGRKHTTSTDLGESLNFLKKHNRSDKYVVIIDDLFLWDSPDHPLIYNLLELMKFIEQYNSKFYVLASTDKVQLDHYSKNFKLSDAFNNTINVKQAKVKEIIKIIKLRHGATHHKLVDQNNNSIKQDQLDRYIKRAYGEGEGNIGDILRVWALSTIELGDKKVRYEQYYRTDLPDFLNEENTIVLKAILLERETTEYKLRNLLGPAFNQKYRDLLIQFLNLKVIHRNIFNNLEISEVLNNQLSDKLKCEGYL